LLGPGPRLIKKEFYKAAVSQRLRNTDLSDYQFSLWYFSWCSLYLSLCSVGRRKIGECGIGKDFERRVEIKCQLDATEVFIADLIACSTCFGHHYAHHQELKSVIQWLLRMVFCAVVFQVAGLV